MNRFFFILFFSASISCFSQEGYYLLGGGEDWSSGQVANSINYEFNYVVTDGRSCIDRCGYDTLITILDDCDCDGFLDSIDIFPCIPGDYQGSPFLELKNESTPFNRDNIPSQFDNCPYVRNDQQWDNDLDGRGYFCDEDDDGDGLLKGEDCSDWDGKRIGLSCPESDGDYELLLSVYGINSIFFSYELGILPTNPYEMCISSTAFAQGLPPTSCFCAEFSPFGPPIPNNTDGDEYNNADDNCKYVVNNDQLDSDGDGLGDLCDNCPYEYAPDSLGGQFGCKVIIRCDSDGDGVNEYKDNCPHVVNPNQTDTDGDGRGDACDLCPNLSQDDFEFGDQDQDGVGDSCDNCRFVYNPNQDDDDSDGRGDLCDNDIDGDGIFNSMDCNIYDPDPYYSVFAVCNDGDPCTINDRLNQYCQCVGYYLDSDNDGVCDRFDECPDDVDYDQDGVCDSFDNATTSEPCDSLDLPKYPILGGDSVHYKCPTWNPSQTDHDGDGIGAVSDNDWDNDGVLNSVDCGEFDPNTALAYGDFCGFYCEDTHHEDSLFIGTDFIYYYELEPGSGYFFLKRPCSLCGGFYFDFPDTDEDGIFDCDLNSIGYIDNCYDVSNPDQLDTDGDGVGDACDNCPQIFNPNQEDSNPATPEGYACDDDRDGDGVDNDIDCDPDDPSVVIYLGQPCDDGDPCTDNDVYDGSPCICRGDFKDSDGDGVCDAQDNCPYYANADQANFDGDEYGDACDDDRDDDDVGKDVDCNDFDATETAEIGSSCTRDCYISRAGSPLVVDANCDCVGGENIFRGGYIDIISNYPCTPFRHNRLAGQGDHLFEPDFSVYSGTSFTYTWTVTGADVGARTSEVGYDANSPGLWSVKTVTNRPDRINLFFEKSAQDFMDYRNIGVDPSSENYNDTPLYDWIISCNVLNNNNGCSRTYTTRFDYSPGTCP